MNKWEVTPDPVELFLAVVLRCDPSWPTHKLLELFGSVVLRMALSG